MIVIVYGGIGLIQGQSILPDLCRFYDTLLIWINYNNLIVQLRRECGEYRLENEHLVPVGYALLDIVPQGFVAVGCVTVGCEFSQRGPVGSHAFHFTVVGYDVWQKIFHVFRRVVHDRAVHLFATVDHGKERQYLDCIKIVLPEKIPDLLVGTQ